MRSPKQLTGFELYGWMMQEWVETSHDATPFLQWVEENHPDRLDEILKQKEINKKILEEGE